MISWISLQPPRPPFFPRRAASILTERRWEPIGMRHRSHFFPAWALVCRGSTHPLPPRVSEAGQLYFHSVTHLSIKTRIIIKKLGVSFLVSEAMNEWLLHNQPPPPPILFVLRHYPDSLQHPSVAPFFLNILVFTFNLIKIRVAGALWEREGIYVSSE